MSAPRTLFPLAAGDTPGAPPTLLDGMEVLFDRTVGLYPVELEPTPGEAVAPRAGAPARNGTANGTGLRH
jgi:hypothetical protein